MLKSTHFGACSDAMQQVHGAGVKSNCNSSAFGFLLPKNKFEEQKQVTIFALCDRISKYAKYVSRRSYEKTIEIYREQ